MPTPTYRIHHKNEKHKNSSGPGTNLTVLPLKQRNSTYLSRLVKEDAVIMTGRKTWSFSGYHFLPGYIFHNSFEAS